MRIAGNFREAVETAERIYGREHDVYVKNVYLYGRSSNGLGRAHKAIPLLRQTVETVRCTKGEDETFSEFNNAGGVGDSAGRSRVAGGTAGGCLHTRSR